MRVKNYILFLYLIIITSCNNQFKQEKSKYLNSVGDIEFNEKLDKKDFYLCNENQIIQYHNDRNALQYKGEKIAITNIFKNKYKSTANLEDDGMIRVRFVVNCKGETDRFRLIAMGDQYKEKVFNKNVSNQILTICKNLDGWLQKTVRGKKVDYYQYLIFKIKDGQIIEIMP